MADTEGWGEIPTSFLFDFQAVIHKINIMEKKLYKVTHERHPYNTNVYVVRSKTIPTTKQVISALGIKVGLKDYLVVDELEIKDIP